METEQKQISIADFTSELEKLKTLQGELDEAERVADQIKEKFTEQKVRVMTFMQENEYTNHPIPGGGKVVIANKFYCAYPQSQEDIEKFHAWLDEQGRGHERKMHSQSLNTLVNNMMEEAKERGEVVELPPGIGLPSTKQELRVYKR